MNGSNHRRHHRFADDQRSSRNSAARLGAPRPKARARANPTAAMRIRKLPDDLAEAKLVQRDQHDERRDRAERKPAEHDTASRTPMFLQ